MMNFFLLNIIFLIPQMIFSEKAVVVVPVADLVGSPIHSFNLATRTEQAYKQLPLCGGISNAMQGCPRLQQLLFNETVEIIDKQNHEYMIRIPHLFYITATDKHPQDIYWISEKNILPLKNLEHHQVPLDKFPIMPSYKTGYSHEQPIITLLFPWHDEVTHKIYSAGTRFVYDPSIELADSYLIFILDTSNHQIKVSSIPKKDVFIEKNKNKADAIYDFLFILRAWSHLDQGNIPYVWGGSSFIQQCNGNNFKEKKVKKNTVIERSDCTNCPQTGFDCAGLIARAAQIAGIPYFYKNTYTLANYLRPLKENERLIEGDLIWIPGHVMVVSDLKKNLMIEARGYPHGYGIVHEIALDKVFNGIRSYQQLINLHHAKSSLVRLDNKGHIAEKISKFALLKLESAWGRHTAST